MMNTLQQFLGRVSPRQILKRELPTSVVTHTSVDEFEHKLGISDSPTFRRLTVDEPPTVVPIVEDPPPIDFTEATPEEIKEWQAQAREAKAAREQTDAYKMWSKLTEDVFYSYATYNRPQVLTEVDPSVQLHSRILPKAIVTDEHAEARNITRGDPTMARIATMGFVKRLRELLGDELSQQMRETQEFEKQREQAEAQQEALDQLRAEAKELHDSGEKIPRELVDEIKQAVTDQHATLTQVNSMAQQGPAPMTTAAMKAIEEAAAAGQDAAEAAAGLPSFGSGLGEGEPVYESPEQAISIAEQWANNPDLRAMAQLFGKLDRDIRFKRAKRVEGGNDEIVDVEIGDNISRALPAELALLTDPDFEDDFWMRFLAGELLTFSTVGEAHVGRGPIVMVMDGSGSMKFGTGQRNIWARATAMVLLHIARLEKRDFALVEFAGGSQIEDWVFLANKPMDGEEVVSMCSHFFGGGTVPINGVTRGLQIMRQSAPFKRADLVLVGDGDASFGEEDKRLREGAKEMGIRMFGIAVGNEFSGRGRSYLDEYCEYVVSCHDFELTDPSQATAELATHIT